MKDDQVLNVMTKYEVREKNKELELKEKELLQSTYQKNLFITLLAVIALLMLLALLFTRSKLRSNAALTAQKLLVEKSLADKELLLREIHHRVKNNMQVISSLLSIQSRDITDEVALKAVNDSRNRVRAMALIHQGLYTEEDLRGIKTTEYISKLCNSLFSSYRIDVDRIKLELEVEEILIDVDSIVPIGLILNELITNALKYAFPDDRKGNIRIHIKELEEGLQLIVSDDGIGISGDRILANEDSFGMKMIKAFSKKLNAEWDIQSEKGTTVSMLIRKYKVIRS
jgi:two-component sensor histidine kinase